MEKQGFTIKALSPSTWDAFAALVEANGGIFGGCWCMGFHPEERTHLDAEQPHREQKLDRVRAGTAHAALVFDGDDCVGWCQFGAPAEVPRIKNRKEYDKQLDELPDWRIACCCVGKGHRRRGVAAAALDGALELIAGLGGGTKSRPSVRWVLHSITGRDAGTHTAHRVGAQPRAAVTHPNANHRVPHLRTRSRPAGSSDVNPGELSRGVSRLAGRRRQRPDRSVDRAGASDVRSAR